MAVTTTPTTKVYPATTTALKFSSPLDDGAFTHSEPAAWLAASTQQLRTNKCVGIPTETVYGLAANALAAPAVQQIYTIKGRPSDNPLIVHISSLRMLRALYHLPAAPITSAPPFLGTDNAALEGERLNAQLAQPAGVWPEIPEQYHEAIRMFWPGPLTIVMPKPECIPMEVLGGHGNTVAFRFPSHPVARAVISDCGLPLAAPSANASGRPSPTLAEHVRRDLDGKLAVVVDAGACDVGVESTVLDAFSANAYVDGELRPCILRPGGVTFEQLKALGGVYEKLRVYKRDFSSDEIEMNPTTPGMKYRHYSPTAPVHLFVPRHGNVHEKMQAMVKDMDGKKVGVIAIGGFEAAQENVLVRSVKDARELAHEIFALLRALDEDDGVDAILVQGVDEDHEGLAVMNRLGKAASRHIVC
ncbi:hypothetical protein EC988_003062 [Linderina pennispora]|nr:hypothetical protein EC988_003062 [Linderina pennispora]